MKLEMCSNQSHRNHIDPMAVPCSMLHAVPCILGVWKCATAIAPKTCATWPVPIKSNRAPEPQLVGVDREPISLRKRPPANKIIRTVFSSKTSSEESEAQMAGWTIFSACLHRGQAEHRVAHSSIQGLQKRCWQLAFTKLIRWRIPNRLMEFFL